MNGVLLSEGLVVKPNTLQIQDVLIPKTLVLMGRSSPILVDSKFDYILLKRRESNGQEKASNL